MLSAPRVELSLAVTVPFPFLQSEISIMPEVGVFLNDGREYHVRTTVALDSLCEFLPDDVNVAVSCYHSKKTKMTENITRAFENRSKRRVFYVNIHNRLARKFGSRRLDGYFQKAWLGDYTKWDTVIVLDVDTLATRPLGPLVQEACNHPFLVSDTPWLEPDLVERKLDPWRNICADFDERRRRLREVTQLPVNTGFYATKRKPRPAILDEWRELLERAHRDALPEKYKDVTDEEAFHLAAANHLDQLSCENPGWKIGDPRWNWSGSVCKNAGQASIIHFHSKSHYNTQVAIEYWLPRLRKVTQENIAGIRDWGPANDPDAYRALRKYCYLSMDGPYCDQCSCCPPDPFSSEGST